MNAIVCTWYQGRLILSCNLQEVMYYYVHGLFCIMKPFKTYDEQIQKLIDNKLLQANISSKIPITGPTIFHIHKVGNNKINYEVLRRNLVSNSSEYVKELLATYGYYNIINQYNKPFLNNDGSYIPNIDFFKLFSLQQMDTRIKNIIFYPLLQIEQRLKTCIAYEFAKVYGPFEGDTLTNYTEPYLDPDNYNQILTTKKKEYKYKILIQRFNKIYQDNTYKPFKHYKNNHGHIPIWVFINKLTFGELYHFYEVLKIQNNISANFKLTPAQLRTCIFFSTQVRNDCAHFSGFYNQNYPKLKKDLPILKAFNSEFGIKDQSNVQNIFLLLIVFKYLLPKSFYPAFIRAIDNEIFNIIFEQHIPIISEYMQKVLMAPSKADYKSKLKFLLNQ